MEHRLITLIPSILAVVSLAACESVEPPQTFDVGLIVECSNCNSHPDRTNLRVFLRPASAMIGDAIRSDIFVDWNEWLFVGTGTDTVPQAFEDIEAGDYLITAASPYPAELVAGGCHVHAADTATWPYIRVTVPSMVHVSPTVLAQGIRLEC